MICSSDIFSLCCNIVYYLRDNGHGKKQVSGNASHIDKKIFVGKFYIYQADRRSNASQD